MSLGIVIHVKRVIWIFICIAKYDMLKITKSSDRTRRGKTRQDKTRRGGKQTRKCPMVLKTYCSLNNLHSEVNRRTYHIITHIYIITVSTLLGLASHIWIQDSVCWPPCLRRVMRRSGKKTSSFWASTVWYNQIMGATASLSSPHIE